MLSKLGRINDTLYRIYERNNFSIITPKKNKRDKFIFVMEGYVKYKIVYGENDLECQCTDNNSIYCKHILYLLNYHFGLNSDIICFLNKPKIYSIFKQGLKSNQNDIENKMNKLIDDFLKEEDCLICYYSLGDVRYNLDLYECKKCKNYVHTKCMNKWISTRRGFDDIKGCVFCREKIR